MRTQNRVIVPPHVVDQREARIKAMALGLASAIFQDDPERTPDYCLGRAEAFMRAAAKFMDDDLDLLAKAGSTMPS